MDAMWRMLQLGRAEDFVVATGRMHSLREFVEAVFFSLGLRADDHVESDPSLLRPSDIARSFGNAGKAHSMLQWKAREGFSEIISKLVEAEKLT